MTRVTLETGTDQLKCEVENGVATITLNRPDKRNALSNELTPALRQMLLTVEAEPSVRCVVITGAGRAFCSGGDVSGMGGGGANAPADAPRPSLEDAVRKLQIGQETLTLRLFDLAKPTIAALPGAAAGAGMSIALACDLRIAAQSAFITSAFANIGLSGDYGGSWLLTQLVGVARAKELYFTSRRVGAEEGLALGIFNEVVPDDQLMARTQALAEIDCRRPADRAALHEGEPQPRRWRRHAQRAGTRSGSNGPLHAHGRSPRGRAGLHRQTQAHFQRTMSNPTMAINAEFLFDFGSPNAYLSHLVIPRIEARTGVKFKYVPVLLGGVFKATNNVSPAVSLQGIKNKPQYTQLETRRFLKEHGITNYAPNPFFPVNTLAIMRGAVFAQREGFFERYVDAVYGHMWAKPKKMDDPEVIAAALTESGLDAEAIFAGTQQPEVKQQLIANVDDAVARGVFGSPSFFVGTELYFGKDRLRDVEEEIERQKKGAGR